MAELVTPEAPILPWPRILRQQWLNLSFLHWTVEPADIAHLYPAGTEPDTFEGRSFVGVVPFQMSLFGTFLETNVRLYSVDGTGRRGVVFLSLDTNRPDIVAGGRLVGAPYRWARMSYRRSGDLRVYTSTLRWPNVSASSSIEVRVGDSLTCGPLEHYLNARWGAHVVRAGRTWYVPNEHPVWRMRSAELVDFRDDGLLQSVALGALGGRSPDHVAFSDGVAARFGRPVLASTPRAV
ncbi:YqjF family protein [Mycobacterium sp. NPDC048908]|uniref:YqjF family protein n=1 Tax=Mycobacterium sp. NPDC048908 TaxID=3364292 RepID=UPI003723A1A6